MDGKRNGRARRKGRYQVPADKHMFAARDINATTEKLWETVFSMEPLPSLCSEHDRPIRQELGRRVGRYSWPGDYGNTCTRSWLDLVNSTKRVFSRVVFTHFTLHGVFTVNSRLANMVSVKFTARPRVWAGLCEISKQAVQLGVRPRWWTTSTGIPEMLDT
jgi:hypothetical protein